MCMQTKKKQKSGAKEEAKMGIAEAGTYKTFFLFIGKIKFH